MIDLSELRNLAKSLEREGKWNLNARADAAQLSAILDRMEAAPPAPAPEDEAAMKEAWEKWAKSPIGFPGVKEVFFIGWRAARAASVKAEPPAQKLTGCASRKTSFQGCTCAYGAELKKETSVPPVTKYCPEEVPPGGEARYEEYLANTRQSPAPSPLSAEREAEIRERSTVDKGLHRDDIAQCALEGFRDRRTLLAALDATRKERDEALELQRAVNNLITADRDRLQKENEQLRKALKAADEWSLKYPLQGDGSVADNEAATAVQDAIRRMEQP